MRTFAFIFARGGSKGVRRKNIRMLGGNPLLAYSIRCGQELDEIEKIFVSTEDPEIAEIANSLQAIVIPRPQELSLDHVPEWDVWKHAIMWVEDNYGSFERFVSIPTTAPFRMNSDVSKCLKALDSSTDLVIAVAKSSHNPWFNMISLDENSCVTLLSGEKEIYNRRQDCPEAFIITTSAYVTRPDYIRKSKGLFDGVVKGVQVPIERALDIDTEHDLFVAESIMKNSQQAGED